jgi:hypothetical protein
MVLFVEFFNEKSHSAVLLLFLISCHHSSSIFSCDDANNEMYDLLPSCCLHVCLLLFYIIIMEMDNSVSHGKVLGPSGKHGFSFGGGMNSMSLLGSSHACFPSLLFTLSVCLIHVTGLSCACSFAAKQVASAVVTRSTRGGTPQVQQPCS